jgi:3-dehydroquinate synthase
MYKRQIPTTVMAMVDSSVGGKTGVNHPLGKNMIGSFHQPNCVFVDLDVLSTLPDRELRSGISEVIKYGLIRDAPFFDWIESNVSGLLDRDPDATRYAVRRSCENKAEVVKADEREGGVRATLNLGHTFGHAIENGSGYGSWLHGEAVSIGTAMAATMSEKMGWIDGELKRRIYDVFDRAGLPVGLPGDSPMRVETFERLMSLDKKVADGKLRLILLKGELGNCVFTGEFDTAALQETIKEFVEEIDARRVL